MTEEINLEFKMIVLYNLGFIRVLSPHMIKTDEMFMSSLYIIR